MPGARRALVEAVDAGRQHRDGVRTRIAGVRRRLTEVRYRLRALRATGYRLGINHFPAYWMTGGRVVELAPDCSSARVALPLSWRTRNVVGTTFGGSIYGAVDPIYMVLLRQRLGRDFTVWDKAATVRFLEPGRSTLYAEFAVDDAEVRQIRASLSVGESIDRVYDVELVDEDGEVRATVEKTVYVRRDA